MTEDDETMKGKEQGWRRITNGDSTSDIDDLFNLTDHIPPFARRHTIDYHTPMQRPGMGPPMILGHGRMWIWTGRGMGLERQMWFDRRRFADIYTLHKVSTPPCKRSHDVSCKV